MCLSIYMEGDYEDFHALRRRKNKANSKPNKLVLSSVEWSQFSDLLPLLSWIHYDYRHVGERPDVAGGFDGYVPEQRIILETLPFRDRLNAICD